MNRIRKEKTTTISFRMPERIADAWRKSAEASGMKLSEYIWKLVMFENKEGARGLMTSAAGFANSAYATLKEIENGKYGLVEPEIHAKIKELHVGAAQVAYTATLQASGDLSIKELTQDVIANAKEKRLLS